MNGGKPVNVLVRPFEKGGPVRIDDSHRLVFGPDVIVFGGYRVFAKNHDVVLHEHVIDLVFPTFELECPSYAFERQESHVGEHGFDFLSQRPLLPLLDLIGSRLLVFLLHGIGPFCCSRTSAGRKAFVRF